MITECTLPSGNLSTVTENIKCFVRCRPLNEKEKELGAGCIKISDDLTAIWLENKSEAKLQEKGIYTLDHVFSESSTQEEIFETVGFPLLKTFLLGYNSTIFAYGQTGAGKTYTMLGPLDSVFETQADRHGLIPRILHFIFNESGEMKQIIETDTSSRNGDVQNLKIEITCSCFEIYHEHIIDLLSSGDSSFEEKLTIREDPKRGMYIEGLVETPVTNELDAKEVIMLGLKTRHVAATSMNAESSRSHLIFTIFLNVSFSLPEGLFITRTSRLHLIDLAGSERQKSTKTLGERTREAGIINKSLSTLGNVINALVEISEGKTRYVPFRDSKLTHFLKDSLGGNAKTTIIANISQSVIQVCETMSTLKFVQRAKMIKNKAIINENVNTTMKMMLQEIKRLKDALAAAVSVESTSTNNILDKNNNNKNSKIEDFPKKEDLDLDLLPFKISSLMTSISQLFTYEDFLSEKLKLLDTISASSIEKFFINKEIYERDYKNLIANLELQIKQFVTELKCREETITEMKEYLVKYQSEKNTHTDRDSVFIEKINLFTQELCKFQSDFDTNGVFSVKKLVDENKLLKKELEVFTSLKECYLNKNKINESTENVNENPAEMTEAINKFIESNLDLKLFFTEHFFNDHSEYTLISKKELEKLKFQIEELKISDEDHSKTIEELQSENFLLNMELMKFKSVGSEIPVIDKISQSSEVENRLQLLEEEREVQVFSNSTPQKIKIDDEKKDFFAKFRDSVFHTSPKKHLQKSSRQDNVNTLGDKCKSESLSKENSELMKLKEKLNDILDTLEERNEDIFEKNGEIEALLIQNDHLETVISQLKEEIETLTESNAIISSDVVLLNNKLNLLTGLNDYDGIYADIDILNSLCIGMYEDYTRDMELIMQYSQSIQQNYLNIASAFQAKEKQFQKRIANLFGGEINLDTFLDENMRLNWDKTKLTKLEKKVLHLKEEKRLLQVDLALLQTDFNASLSEHGLNSKIQLLMKIKEDNYNLQLELNALKLKNLALEKDISLYQEMLDGILADAGSNQKAVDVFLSFKSMQSKDIMVHDIQITKENEELFNKIFQLDRTKKVKKDSVNKFDMACEILNNTQEILELHRFYVDTKFKGGIINKNEISASHSQSGLSNATEATYFKTDEGLKQDGGIKKITHPPESFRGHKSFSKFISSDEGIDFANKSGIGNNIRKTTPKARMDNLSYSNKHSKSPVKKMCSINKTNI